MRRCRHVLDNGQQCTRARRIGRVYCWQHAPLYDREGERIAPPPPPPPPGNNPVVTPAWVAGLLSQMRDSLAKREFAQEFAEAYLGLDRTFNVQGFIAAALAMPPVERQ